MSVDAVGLEQGDVLLEPDVGVGRHVAGGSIYDLARSLAEVIPDTRSSSALGCTALDLST